MTAHVASASAAPVVSIVTKSTMTFGDWYIQKI